MSDRNTFSAGLGAKVVGAIADVDGTPEEANTFAEKPELVRGMLAVLRGTAEIVMKKVGAVRVTLLELIGTVKVAATTNKFVAKDKFKLKQDGGVCSYISDAFKTEFLVGEGKVEGPFAGSQLCYSELLKAATGMPRKPGEAAIIPEIGGEVKVEASLVEMDMSYNNKSCNHSY